MSVLQLRNWYLSRLFILLLPHAFLSVLVHRSPRRQEWNSFIFFKPSSSLLCPSFLFQLQMISFTFSTSTFPKYFIVKNFQQRSIEIILQWTLIHTYPLYSTINVLLYLLIYIFSYPYMTLSPSPFSGCVGVWLDSEMNFRGYL